MNVTKFLLYVVLLGIIAGAGFGSWLLFKDQQGPLITVVPGEGRVGKSSEFTISLSDEVSGLKDVTVSVRKNTNISTLKEEQWADKAKQKTVTINLEDTKLKDGSFELVVKATDASFAAFGKGNAATRAYQFRLDTTPPRVSISTMPPNVRKGGTGMIAYSVSEEVQSTGVQAGEAFFPGYKVSSDQGTDKYICFFAFPYYMTPDEFNPRLVTIDIAGNVNDRSIAVNALDRKFRSDVIRLPDSFLDRKMPDFEQDFPGEMTNLERFLKVNRDLRKANRAELLSIGRQTAADMLWSGSFMRLPNAANRAGFADHRTYKYNGIAVDDQYHLGHDLASTRHASVPCGNDGTVVFADNMGIYGRVVIVDHGLGLQSLYSHLSEIHVQPGQSVKRGTILGKTGATGMAGGDHLHFGVLVSGMPVTPLEWFDARWIRHNITDRLQ